MTTVVVPFAASLVGTGGTGKLETIDANTFSWNKTADADFAGSISVSAMQDLFAVSEVSDSAADMTVAIVPSKEANFEAAIMKALKAGNAETAKLTHGGEATANDYNKVILNSSTVKDYMLNVAQYDIDTDLGSADGIAAGLAAEQVKSLLLPNFDIDASTAAISMYNGLADAGAGNLRKIIALQYGNVAYLSSNDGTDVVDPKKIPFAAGDKVVFRFLVDQSYNISQDPKALTSSPAGGAVTAVNDTSSLFPQTGYNVGQRIIDLTLTLA